MSQTEAELKAEIEQFKAAITELEERYEMLLEQSVIGAIQIPKDGSPDEILRAAMVGAELAAQRESQQAGIEQAIAAMRSILTQKEDQLEQMLGGLSLEERIEVAAEHLQDRATQINALANQLKLQLEELRLLAQRYSQDWQTLYGLHPLKFDAELLNTIPYVISLHHSFAVVPIEDSEI